MSKGSINKVIIIGTLGRDPEVRFTQQGDAVCTLSVATDEGYKNKQTGQQVDATEWHRIELFGKLAEIAGEYLKKGSKAYFEGKLKTDEYEKDGIKRYSTKIKAFSMTMLDSRQDNQQPAQQQPVQQPPQNPGYAAQQPPRQMPPMAQRAPQQNQIPDNFAPDPNIPF